LNEWLRGSRGLRGLRSSRGSTFNVQGFTFFTDIPGVVLSVLRKRSELSGERKDAESSSA
jgi:hypothetical protein